MTYFDFLLRFICIPILLLLCLHLLVHRRFPVPPLPARLAWGAIGIHILLALLYTTPWDNYLVATGVWFYNPALVTGILLGYVPLEEYTFFVLQTILVGLWWLFCRNMVSLRDFIPSGRQRLFSTLSLVYLWLFSALVFFSGWQPATYLSITAFWVLPPLILQSAFGADILWHSRRLLLGAILPIGLYLSFVDSLAITATTWEIDRLQSTGIFIGRLPLEEGFFFFVTVILLVCGMTLLASPHSHRRIASLLGRLKRRARQPA